MQSYDFLRILTKIMHKISSFHYIFIKSAPNINETSVSFVSSVFSNLSTLTSNLFSLTCFL